MTNVLRKFSSCDFRLIRGVVWSCNMCLLPCMLSAFCLIYLLSVDKCDPFFVLF